MPETNSKERTEAIELEASLKKAFGDRYELVARLGSGAFGVVYRALDTMLDRDVAIKQVRLDKFQNSDEAEQMKRRAQREAKMAAKLRHPNIVAIHDIVQTDNSTLIIMEFVDGDNLELKLQQRQHLGLEETLELVAQTAGALDHAHAQGVVHRDIKPANLMIDGKGQIKITDFGIAKSQAGTEMTSNITATGTVLGTPYYMSPEQARGEALLDGRSDLFSLGCVTYECLAGRKPFRGKSVVEVLLQIVNGEPGEIDYDALLLNPDLETVLGKALSKQAATRYPSAGELVEALRSVPAMECRGDGITLPVVTSREPGASTSFDINIQGSLGDKGLAEILHDIQAGKKAGILHLQRDNISKRLYFLDGSIVFANSDLESDRLGQFLIDGGILDKETYERAARAMKKTRRRLGETLVALGNLDDAKMDALINDQIQQIIYSVFSWESGHYGFEMIAKPVEDDIVVEFSTDEIILDGVRRMATESTVRNAIGSMDQILCHSDASVLDAGNVTLTSSEGFVLSRVDGSTSVADIAAISPLGEDETLRCIYGLVSASVLCLKIPKAHTTTRASKVQEQKPETPTLSVAPAPREPVQSESEAICEEIVAKHASLEGASYYEILDASRGATPDAIKKAYYTLAKKYHPDRHRGTEFQGVQSQLEEILGNLSDAYEVLSSSSKRLRYDNKLPRPQPTSAPNPTSTAKPDSSSDVDKAEAIASATPTVQTSPAVIAEAKFLSGLGYFKDGNYHDAVVNLREAVRLAPVTKPAYDKALGHALAKNPKWRKQAESHFQKALTADPFDLDCYLALAEIYEAEGLAIRAREMYEKTITIDPDHEIANAKLDAGNQPERTFLQKLMGRADGASD